MCLSNLAGWFDGVSPEQNVSRFLAALSKDSLMSCSEASDEAQDIL